MIVCDDGRAPGRSYELKTEVEEARLGDAVGEPDAVGGGGGEAEAASAAVEFHRMGPKLGGTRRAEAGASIADGREARADGGGRRRGGRRLQRRRRAPTKEEEAAVVASSSPASV